MKDAFYRMLSADVTPFAVAAFTAALAYIFKLRASSRQRKREKNTITRALLREVQALNEVICLRLEWWDKEVTPDKWLPPLIPITTDAFDHLVGKIPKLDQDIAQALIEFYGYIHFINEFQKTKDEHVDHDMGKFYYDRYAEILNDHLAKRGDHAFAQYYDRCGLSWEVTECRSAWDKGRAEKKREQEERLKQKFLTTPGSN